jgi:uncharacterized protein YjhX (UPF0386 family)
MQKAIDKARTVKPLVRVVNFGSYTVTNKQTGATYSVTCEKRNGERFADCTCKAGARGLRCYHVAAAAGCHIVLAAERATHNA